MMMNQLISTEITPPTMPEPIMNLGPNFQRFPSPIPTTAFAEIWPTTLNEFKIGQPASELFGDERADPAAGEADDAVHQVRSEEEREPVLAQASLRRVECCVRPAVEALRAESRLPDALFVAHEAACDEECVGDECRLRDCSDCVRELCDWLSRVFRLLEPRLLGSC